MSVVSQENDGIATIRSFFKDHPLLFGSGQNPLGQGETPSQKASIALRLLNHNSFMSFRWKDELQLLREGKVDTVWTDIYLFILQGYGIKTAMEISFQNLDLAKLADTIEEVLKDDIS